MGRFSGEMHGFKLFYNELSPAEISLLAGTGAVKVLPPFIGSPSNCYHSASK